MTNVIITHTPVPAAVNMFNATASLAEAVFNATYLRLKGVHGLPEIEIHDARTGKSHFESLLQRAYGAALSLNFANQGTSAHWLAAGLSKVHGMPISVESASFLNEFMIEEGVIEKRSVLRNTSTPDGRIRTDKVWLLTEKYREQVQFKLDNPDRLFKIEARPVKVSAYSKDLVKGLSKVSKQSLKAIRKLNEVAFSFHKDSEDLLTKAQTDLNKLKLPREEKDAKEMSINALADQFKVLGSNKFHLTYTHDYRARMYARGGAISTQGDKTNKAIIRFYHPEIEFNYEEVTIFLGRLAGCKGTNNQSYDLGVLEWESPSNLEALAVISDPYRAIIRLDGCANGIQWMSAFLNNSVGMRMTNLSGATARRLSENKILERLSPDEFQKKFKLS